jgi:hypothetical protein
VGTAEGPDLSAVRWTQGTGAVPLGPVTGLPLFNGDALAANAVSADGSVGVGSGLAIYQTFPMVQTTFVPFRWAGGTNTGILDNGQFFGVPFGAYATSISADGSVIAGMSGAGVWRWTASTGFQIVRTQPFALIDQRLSGDGNTLTDGDQLWRAGTGSQLLTTILSDSGCTFPGWTNLYVTDVSFNGQALCGFGTNPAGLTEAWYATIPAPGATVVALTAFGIAALRRRR